MTQDTLRGRIRAKLSRLYGAERGEATASSLFAMIDEMGPFKDPALDLSEHDVILITYGDMVKRQGESPLATLHDFLKATVYPAVNGVHILPFFPYSSDDGFSVIDYYKVNPDFGNWDDVRALGRDFNLMFDAVINHISAQSDWFQRFLQWEAPYRDYFMVIAPGTDLSEVVRPRALPLLHPFQTPDGEKLVWTTFSADQVDLNYESPELLLEVLRVLLFYVQQGAALIRMDAIAFIWKVPGTSSIHLPEAHLIIQLMRDVLDMVAPSVVVITETNVPHEENISYFGDGTNEAQMVYNFALPPLTLHTLATGDAKALTKWASSLELPGDRTSFFNFTASHDGIGLRPATGLLSQKQVDALVKRPQDHGGLISYRSQSDGSQKPYEMNINYFDAVTNPAITEEDPATAVKRFIVSQAIMLALVGVPGIYFHSLFGSRNWREGVAITEHNRTINRQKLDAGDLEAELEREGSIRQRVFKRYMHMLRVRTGEPAFHPHGDQEVMDVSSELFALRRRSPDGEAQVIALHNVTGKTLTLDLPVDDDHEGVWRDLLGDESYMAAKDTLTIVLEPYQVAWLKPSAAEA